MFQHVLVAVDGSPTGNRGLKAAIGLASDQKATLTILHAVDDMAGVSYVGDMGYVPTGYVDKLLDDLRANGRKVLTKAEALARAGGVDAKVLLVETKGRTIADVILAQARKVRADVIVLAIAVWFFISIAWTASTLLRRGAWQPVTATTSQSSSFTLSTMAVR